jgi:translation initiation factor 2 beta subunit (eIF-2beta)/eIF-5
MDHAEVEEKGLVELYHRGLLPPGEEARFEEHFVGCPECTEQLELARGFQKGLRAMAAEDAARAVAAAGLLAWLVRRGPAVRWGLGLAVLLLAALPALLLFSQGRRERLAAADWRARAEAQRQANAELERRLAETKPRETSRGLSSPLVNTPVFLLSALRGGEGKPVTVDLSRAGEALSLAVDVGEDSRFETYRATITRVGGATVFEKSGLKPNALEALMITFPSSFFPPGDYRLRVEGVGPDGGAAEVGGYPFRVVGR